MDLVEAAKLAIDQVFNDTSVTVEDTKDRMKEIQEHVTAIFETLDEE